MDNLFEYCLLALSKLKAQKKEEGCYTERVMGINTCISVYIFDFVVKHLCDIVVISV